MVGSWRATPASCAVACLAVAALGALGLVGCGSEPHLGVDDGRLRVVAALYPLAWLAEEVGGDRVAVEDLSAGGGDAHDLELSGRQVAEVRGADLVVHLAGFQPAVDDAVEGAGARVWDVAEAADLMAIGEREDHDHAAEEDGHDHELSGAADPHFWLDPVRMASVADGLGSVLAEADPGGARGYRARAAAVGRELRALDRAYAASLATCRDRELVTSHGAFGYLAAAYDLDEVGITGISPEAEPPPRTMARLVDAVRGTGARTVYVEAGGPSDVAETVAGEAGAEVAELDPLEVLGDRAAGLNYVGVMRSNLATLVRGQRC